MSNAFDPLDSIKRARKAMDHASGRPAFEIHGGDRPAYAPPLQAHQSTPCAVLVKSLVEGGPVPDDLQGIQSATQLQSHVRPDGAVYKGAFELQGDRGQQGTLVVVYGDTAMTVQQAERIATMERPALQRRHEQWALGPFAAQPTDSAPPPTPSAA